MTTKPKLCKACDGTVWHYGDCMRCKGKGVVTKPKRGQPRKPESEKRVKYLNIRLHPLIAAHLDSAVQMGSISKTRFVELSICDKLGIKHPDIKD